MRTRTRTIASLITAILALGAFACYSPFAENEGLRGLSSFLPAALGFAAAWRAWPRFTRRRLLFALPAAFALALSCAVGARLQVHGELSADAGALMRGTMVTLGFTALITCALSLVMERLDNTRAQAPASPLALPAMWAAIFLCWVPVWLAYFPALTNYDIESHLTQCLSNEYTTLHPLLYTLTVKLFTLTGGPTTAMALLAAFQLLLMSFSCAYALDAARSLGAGRRACAAALVFFALFPVFPLLAISTGKDAPFAAFALMTFAGVARMLSEREGFFRAPRRVAGLVICAVLMALYRYNGVISLGILAALTLFFAKGIRIKAATVLSGALAAAVLLTLGMNALFDVKKSFVPERDMASLPSQQMIRVALETEDAHEYERILSYYDENALKRYEPRLADYTKMYLDLSQDYGWRGYIKLWIATGIRHPKAYIEGFLELTRGMWFADDISHANIYPLGLPLFGYLTNNQNTYDFYPIEHYSLLPSLKGFYDGLTTENLYLNCPVLRVLFSLGYQCWALALMWVIALYRRDGLCSIALIWPISLALVLLAAPAVLARYMLPVTLILPVAGLLITRRAPLATRPKA